ncbi:MAG: SCO family protein [Chloroflexota bacterium]
MPGVPMLAALTFLALAALILLFMLIKPVKVLPYHDPVPAYTLTDQDGQLVSDADLRGRIVLYDFIYTSCTTVCPAMTGQMLQVQNRLAEEGQLGRDVTLVTITFDPERDTPERLREYARQVNTSDEGWLWLTGDLLTIKQLVGAEFGVYFEKVPLDPASAEAVGLSEAEIEAGYDFVHASVFVLADEEGVIRAEYHELTLSVDEMLRDVELLVREKNARGPGRLLRQAAHLINAYP